MNVPTFEYIMDGALWLLLVFAVVLTVLVIWIIVDDHTQDTIDLPKSDWSCVETKEKKVTAVIFTGKVPVAHTQTVQECQIYKKR